jgi:hypothetical protein
MKTYQKPQKNGTALGWRSFENINKGTGLLVTRKQKWKGKKVLCREGCQGMEENLKAI